MLYVTVVQWQGQKCNLVIHYENGFTLLDVSDNSDLSKPNIHWNYSFEKLRMSADDGSRLVWLDFGEDGEQASQILLVLCDCYFFCVLTVVADYMFTLIAKAKWRAALMCPLFLSAVIIQDCQVSHTVHCNLSVLLHRFAQKRIFGGCSTHTYL